MLKPEPASISVNDLLRQLEVEFTPLAREKGLELVFLRCSLSVRSDRRLLRRLLQNLVSNAIKYTPEGRVLVGCRRRRGRLRFDVCDTGLGIPTSKRKAVFQEFHRLDQGMRAARGLGLGLSIVERIARVLDHKVELVSEPGRGSRFSVTVPVAPPEASAARTSRSLPRPQRPLANTVVLCLDNEPSIVDGMEALLGGWGCRVVKATDLTGALAAAASDGPLHGLIIDYHLDEGSGIDAIVALRRQFGANLPAILITADRSPRVRQQARAHQVALLNKPVKPAALRALLAQWPVQRLAAAE